ncbi:hypothetical protein P691DRAFT_756201 [Macrolepiota fuliginosa MF-IS2]|uniref:Uncharacterized protein n=1 Tax=Macrolepiota fuliginosa MF-IS2 TaxID=1400762 RepID=A0A9P6C872_9AGAR|nr:hypothetical protein P691DRAFT_756201 [Macrolepiota fuliginosa MF-IS2]
MLTALVAAEKYFEPSNPFGSLTGDECFWRLCLGEQKETIYISLALAQFIIHGKYPRKWLLVLETLEHFRTVIMSIVKQQVPRDLEQISQLACPTLCLAVVRLLADFSDANSRTAKHFFMNSPWTVIFCADMENLLSHKLNSLDTGLYRDRMRHILEETGVLLLQALSDDDEPNISANAVSEMLARGRKGVLPLTSIEVLDYDTKLFLYRSQVLMIAVDGRAA